MGAKMIDSSVLESVGMLSKVIIALTAAELINGIAGLFDISLVDVATELSAFMVALSPFIMNSKLLNPESMQACKYLAEMIIALTGAELLAGIGEFLGIRGSLSGFGAELASLGPDIKQFAEDVKDIKPEAVEGAAAAAELMANLANKLPAQDGWLQTVLGNKSLSDFADQLVDFGPSIAEFADTVKDVDPDSVEGAAAAAEIMAKLSEKLPAQDGWIQKVFGDKSLADFGAELSAFGPDIVKFANQVKNVTASSVTGVSLATAMMATLADGLPSTDNLFEKIFGGGQMTISEFGEELIAFGKSMSDFSSSLSGVDTEQMGKVVTVFKDLVDIANLANGASGAGLVNFTNQLGSVSSETINNFIQNFSSAGTKAAQALVNNINTKKPLAISAIKNLCTAIVSQLKTSLPASTFTKTGQGIILGIINGINANKPLLISTVKNICTVIVSNFKNNLSESTFKSLGNSVISAFKSSMSQSAFKEIGANAALGLKLGIESKISEVGKAAAKAAKQSVDSAKKELDEHSPSKVMKQVGQYFSIGLANGIIDQIKTISKAGTKAADEAIDPVKKAVDSITEIVNSGFLDDDPVIRPVMDLSNVQNGVNEISSLMNRTYDLSSVYNKAMDVSASFNSANKSRTGRDGVGSSNADESVKYEFIQNNYSPKALNRSEIYRQTNNQFSQLKRAVKIQ